MYRKHLLRRVGLSIVSLITAVTMTGCSIGLKPISDVANNPEKIIEVIQDAVDSYSDEQLKDSADTLAEELSEVAIGNGYELQTATLVRVVDGDTIVVEIDGEETKVRLIGINTPESVASAEYLEKTGKENTEEGAQASDWVKEFLMDYPTLYLQKDTSETDKYGRLLRYVWVSIPTDTNDITEIQSKMLNGILLENGLAEVTIYKPDTEYADEFAAIESDTTDLYEIDR